MRIKLIKTEQEMEVVGFYRASSKNKIQRIYYAVSSPIDGGRQFNIVDEDETILINSEINFKAVLTESDSIGDSVVHHLIGDPNFLYDIIDSGRDSFQKFEAGVKAEYIENEGKFAILPFDALRHSSEYPESTEAQDTYYFCPNCFEANEKANFYDEAIRCPNCETIYNTCSKSA